MQVHSLLNLTPHDICITLSHDTITLHPEPVSARLTPHYSLEPDLTLFDGSSWSYSIPLARRELGMISGLQYDDKGLIKPCIVSLVVLQYMEQLWASAKRSPYHDPGAQAPLIFSPDTGPSALRDGAGRITSVTRLLCI